MYVKLNLNECPYPPSRKVVSRVMEYVNSLNRYYIEGLVNALLNKLSNYVGLSKEFISLVPGSESFITYSALRFRLENLVVVSPDPTFEPALQDFINCGVRVRRIPLNEDFNLDWDKLLEELSDDAVLYVSNPNNPTGNLVVPSESSVIEACSKARYVILDEAYYEFSGVTYVKLAEDLSNLIIMRTFSKAFALAGARIGYVIAQPGTLRKVLSLRRSFDIPITSYAAALGAIEDLETSKEYVRRILETKERVVKELRGINEVKVVDTLTNYILVGVKGLSGNELAMKLRSKGILVKSYSHPLLSNYVRTSIGTNEEMNYFIEKVKEIVNESTHS